MAQKGLTPFDLWFDFSRGVSQREMERKYDLNYSTISRRAKKITVAVFSENHLLLNKSMDQIKTEINKIARKAYECPLCQAERDFFSENLGKDQDDNKKEII